MAISNSRRSAFWFLAVAALILLADFTLLRVFALSEEEPALVYAVMFDLMLVVPLLYAFLVLRPRKKPIAKAMALPLLGAGAVWLMVPASQRGMVWGAAWPVEAVIIVAELAFLAFEIRIVYRLVRSYRALRKTEPDVMEAWRSAIRNGFSGGKLASVLLHDVSLVYYLLFSWRKKKKIAVPADESLELEYSYHRTTNQLLYSAILTKIVLVEGIAVHLLVSQWSHWAAWILTLADLWLLALVWADCRASVLKPVGLGENRLRLRYGLRIQADIPLEAISGVACAREFQPEPAEMKRAAGPVWGTSNVRIDLRREIEAEGVLFLPIRVTAVYLALDEPEAFARELERRIAVRGD